MAIAATLVGTGQSTNNTVVTASGTTSASGSTFALGFCFDNGVTITSVADSKLNTYVISGSVQVDPDTLTKTVWYVCQNGTGGTLHTATVVFSGTAFPTAHLVEITGAATASLDKAGQGTDSATPFTITTATLTQANEVILTIAAINFNASGTNTYSSGGVGTIIGQQADASQFWTSAVSKLNVTATTAVTPSFTCLQGTHGSLAYVTFKEAGGSPDVTVALTGIASTSGIGFLGITHSQVLSGGSSTLGQGTISFQNGPPLIGQAITTGIGTLSVQSTMALSGSQSVTSLGTIKYSPSFGLTASPVTTSIGNLGIASNISLAGTQVTVQQGSISIPGGGHTVTIFNRADRAPTHQGITRPTIQLQSLGGGFYNVTSLSSVENERADTVMDETYLVDGTSV